MKFDIAIKLYYICVGLQARDAFFSNMKQIYLCSPNLVDEFLAKVLLEAERRYAKDLAHTESHSSGWQTLLLNPQYHYTLRGYNRLGWMAVMLEMEVANQGMVYTYHAGDWNCWMVRLGRLRPKHFFQSGDHVELEWDAIL
ncbi:hypothetical protein EDD18DRAFT_1343220 [Armillaria luteobubalina]|uniref:Uncharacterized protein n=1 Tax=Armillaria luteobubalina TaxID=153913 RepID=A0AA39QQW5_9AGAR|nr:hypothetical protein EDD18DRAFT_1343220 [Armillaria luteobubalina]